MSTWRRTRPSSPTTTTPGRPWARPLSHWSMGWLPLWSRFASHGTSAGRRGSRGCRWPSGWVGSRGSGTSRPSPSRPSPSWFAARRKASAGLNGPVVLWPDTFTNYLAPEVGRAAVEVLEAAGYEVVLPDRPVCCGLTWISTGQLRRAKNVIERSLATLEPHLNAGTPVVGLEPSCTAALRHDAPNLLPDSHFAGTAATSIHTFAEFLNQSGWEPPRAGKEALVQTHCHQHAVLGFDADRALMTAAGISAVVPDSGCCGLAGNFGFERGHYESQRRWVNASCCLRFAPPRPTRPSSPTASAAAPRSATARRRQPVHLAQVLADATARGQLKGSAQPSRRRAVSA